MNQDAQLTWLKRALVFKGDAAAVGITSLAVWVSAVLVLLFAVAFYLMTPKAA